MKKTINNIILFPVLLLLIASCAVTDFDRKVDFNRYKTFAWGESEIKVENPLHKSDLISKNIKTTVENEFAKRGISYNSKNPDFLVSYHTYTEKREETNSNNYFYGPYMPFSFRYIPFGYGWGFPYGWSNNYRNYTYTEGTLIIDITDRKTDEVVWRGSVSGNVNNTGNLQKQIRKGIKAIMKKYPVRANEELQLPDDKTIS
ncbi:DUF4136 domain-containing protein [Chryseosolibacter indicus]|uniref:DUF4136 domain-containing protein n=1 Tax=Chryseosolibacter indicus TaxID=2782351 RepID=A0ABS5VPJ9_9BACT|nr:DUF4136 domain-containing protein [Chryseosolibacter indicus]MBT1703359.1 DUF4136 domain-containing protein [Chryseosolibacter indicus]